MTDEAKVERSAGGVVLRRIDGTLHALVIRDPYLNWGLPKGHVEEGETEPQAALREVTEETGLLDVELGPELVTIDWFFRSRGAQIHKYTTFFLMYSARGEPVPEQEEGIRECVWIRLDEADRMITYDNASEVVKVAQSMVAEGEEPIPTWFGEAT